MVSTNTTMSYNYDTYLVNATANIILTLPPVTCDGIYFLIRRTDNNSFTATVTGSIPSETINGFASITIQTASEAVITSYSGVWYTLTSNVVRTGYFSAFRITNTNVTIPTGATGILVTYSTLGPQYSAAGSWVLGADNGTVTVPVTGNYKIDYSILTTNNTSTKRIDKLVNKGFKFRNYDYEISFFDKESKNEKMKKEKYI